MQRMATNGADFTLTFRQLCDAVPGSQGDEEVRNRFADAGAYNLWASEWRRRLEEEPVSAEARASAMRLADPVYIPRNHMVEAALDAAVERRDFQPFEDLLKILSHPMRKGRAWNSMSRSQPRGMCPTNFLRHLRSRPR